MIKRSLVFGVLGLALFFSSNAVGAVREVLLRPTDSDFHRYPPQTLFTPDGKLVIAYRIAGSKDASSALRIAVFEKRGGTETAKHTYQVPFAGRTKIADGFILSRDGLRLYYVELTGNPVVLEIMISNLEVLSKSTTKLFNENDALARVERATVSALFLSAQSKMPGKAVHIVALDASDVSKTVVDEQVSDRPGLRRLYTLSFDAQSLWMGGGKDWFLIGIKSGQVEAKIHSQNDLEHLLSFSSGSVGAGDRNTEGVLELFDTKGRQVQTLIQRDCGFKSVQLSFDENYGAAVCEKTGTSEWLFGKTLERKAIVFDTRSMVSVQSISLSKFSLQTNAGTDDWHAWSPKPRIWSSGPFILVDTTDMSGTVVVQEIVPLARAN